METFTTKIGVARQFPNSRVWIEGARLVRAGFIVGARYTLNCICANGRDYVLHLTLASGGGRKVSGKGLKPIIDITGDTIRQAFPHRATVHVVYTSGTITIS